jgi:hypothetical protein
VVADRLYGEHPEFKRTMWRADVPYVLAVKPSQVVWKPTPEPASPWAVLWEAVDRLRWTVHNDTAPPGAWTPVVRRFHDGHEETWWALDLRLGSYAPEYPTRLVVATSDPRLLPQASTWYLVTNLPVPGTSRAAEHPTLPVADLAEVVRLYGLRQWVEQGYKPVKQELELGWADFQVRSDRAIRRHWELVCCAFCFCWWADRSRADASTSALAPLPAAPSAGAGDQWSSGRARVTAGLPRRAHHLLAVVRGSTATAPSALVAVRRAQPRVIRPPAAPGPLVHRRSRGPGWPRPREPASGAGFRSRLQEPASGAVWE